uniref:TBC1 domain family member 5 n=2 Tax=Bursaphelenchus xylophilus TaxID=6326 RepID=A0A1I7SS74_BURXY
MKTDLYHSYVDMLGKSVQRFMQMEEERVVQEKELRVKRASLPAEPTFSRPPDSPALSLDNSKAKLTGQFSALSTPSRHDSNHRFKHRSTSTSSTLGDDESSSQCSDGSISKRNPSALGRIDPLGRYESLFDTSLYHLEEPPKNGFRGVLNKYLKQSMAQEDEKSYEMARLIVEDIRNMVMSQENVHSLPATPKKANMSG